MTVAATSIPAKTTWRVGKRTFKVLRKLALAGLAIYFAAIPFALYLLCGVLDVMRNTCRNFTTLNRYFTGNGVFTWLLSPFNLFLDLLSLPFRNKGVYQLDDLPIGYQEEIKKVIEAAHRGDVVGKLEAKMEGQKRGMMFFKWYGKNVAASVDIPEFHEKYKYIRTIGVSVFNKKQSTGKHFGPLRVTLRVLYNINDIDHRHAFIKVGSHTHYWQDKKLFIFDDTLQHQSCNESDGMRHCMFIDILRPSLFPRLASALVSCIRLVMAPFNAVFYKHWAFIK